MKLILLPGLDGTGNLLKPFVNELGDNFDISIIQLPSGDDQSYDFITRYVRERLPQNDRFILLAESFSGPIAYRLLQDDVNNLVSVIFVATFIRRPTFLVKLASCFAPEFLLKKSFISDSAVRTLLFGSNPGNDLIHRFWQAVNETGTKTLKQRLKSIGSLSKPTQKISKACFYIQAENDLLVPNHNFADFQKHFENIKLYRINGPHLILQTRAEECASAVNEILSFESKAPV